MVKKWCQFNSIFTTLRGYTKLKKKILPLDSLIYGNLRLKIAFQKYTTKLRSNLETIKILTKTFALKSAYYDFFQIIKSTRHITN